MGPADANKNAQAGVNEGGAVDLSAQWFDHTGADRILEECYRFGPDEQQKALLIARDQPVGEFDHAYRRSGCHDAR